MQNKIIEYVINCTSVIIIIIIMMMIMMMIGSHILQAKQSKYKTKLIKILLIHCSRHYYVE
jgi:hypothetical protein